MKHWLLNLHEHLERMQMHVKKTTVLIPYGVLTATANMSNSILNYIAAFLPHQMEPWRQQRTLIEPQAHLYKNQENYLPLTVTATANWVDTFFQSQA